MHRQVFEFEESARGPSQVEPAPELIRLDQPSPKPPIALGQLVTVVGSKADAHLQLRSRQVSGAHCVLVNMGYALLLRDLASRTGVFVNERRIEEVELAHGDILRVGRYRYSVSQCGAMRKSRSANVLESAILRTSAGSLPINRRIFTIGRQRSADLHLDGKLVSKAHAILVRASAQWVICDLCSRSGTRLNGVAVQISALRNGDTIQIGEQEFVFSAEPATVEPIANNSLPSGGENAPASCVDTPEVDAHEPLAPAIKLSGPDDVADPLPPEQPETPPPAAPQGRERNAKVIQLDYLADRALNDAPSRRERNPNVICRAWGPLAAAVAEPQLLERIAASRGRVTSPGQQAAASKQAIEAMVRPAWRPSPGQTIAIATATVTFLGAAWFVISHPHFLTQLW